MYFAIIVIVGFFLWYISRQTSARPIEIQGKSVLRLHSIFGLLAIVCMILGLFMPFYSLIIGDFSTAGVTILIGLLTFFFGMGYWLFSWYRNYQVIFDDREITVVYSIKNQKTFQWSDIKDIKLYAWSCKYILTLKSGKTVGIHQYMTGIEDFIKKLEKRITACDIAG